MSSHRLLICNGPLNDVPSDIVDASPAQLTVTNGIVAFATHPDAPEPADNTLAWQGRTVAVWQDRTGTETHASVIVVTGPLTKQLVVALEATTATHVFHLHEGTGTTRRLNHRQRLVNLPAGTFRTVTANDLTPSELVLS